VAGAGISAKWAIVVLGHFKAMLSGTRIKKWCPWQLSDGVLVDDAVGED
jgi:hypothetical protein